MTTEVMTSHTPKAVMIDPRANNSKNRARIEADEKELEELMKADAGEQDEAPEEVKAEDTDGTPEVPDESLSKEEQTFKKRYGDLRRHQAKQEQEWKDKLAAAQEGPNKNYRTPTTDEDLDKWAKKYPDVASIVETIASKKAKEMLEATNSRFQELDELTYATQRGKAETTIRKAHSDFDDLKGSDEFHDWAEEQPTWIKNALYDNEDDASGVIRVIDLYKTDKGMTPAAKKSNAKAAASDVKTGGSTRLDATGEGKKYSESQINRESDAWFEKNADKIQEAMNTGNFVYDMTRRK